MFCNRIITCVSALLLAGSGLAQSPLRQCGDCGGGSDSCTSMGVMHNPVIWADVPDPDVIRVGDDFYMVSTTMHLMPGCPVMHSKDLFNL